MAKRVPNVTAKRIPTASREAIDKLARTFGTDTFHYLNGEAYKGRVVESAASVRTVAVNPGVIGALLRRGALENCDREARPGHLPWSMRLSIETWRNHGGTDEGR
jgi:hypothetical protein